MKKRDSKNRILRNGESQRPDGRYRYRYTDSFGKTRDVYSWKLEKNDRVPAGKKQGPSLRELEKQIIADQFNQIIPEGGNLTVYGLVERYVSLRTGVRPRTQAGYQTVLNILKKDSFGNKRIDRVKLSDAKSWLIELQKNGRGYSSIRTIRGVLRPAFRMAYEDDLIRKNPFDFELCTVIYNDSETREALSRADERRFLDFIKEDSHFCKYYDGIYVLLNTGLRISEFVGLTKSDINFDEMYVNVDHQLHRLNHIGYSIVEPKTDKGIRKIPMTEEVAECFRRIIQNRKKVKVEPFVDGYGGFLFLDKNGNPMVALHWEKYFQHIVEKYNRIFKQPLPKITPHVCRHTFCSRMAASRMNPKTLQYIMGHSEIGVTLNVYTHLGFEDASAEVKRIQKETESDNTKTKGKVMQIG